MKKKLLLLSVFTAVLTTSCGIWLWSRIAARVEGDYLDANGVRVHYTVEGTGEPLILIHGLAAQADWNWRRNGVVDLLDDHFRVIAFDLRGHGLSDKPHDPEAYGAELKYDVLRLMDHLNIDRAHIVGYSLGGFIALHLLAEQPDRVLSAAVCAAGWRDPSENTPLLNQHKPSTVVDGGLDGWIGDMQAASFDLTRPLRRSARGMFIDSEALKALRESIPDIEGISRDVLVKNTTPLLCIIGENDGFLPYAQALKEVRPDTKLVIVEDSGHLTTAARAIFGAELRRFLLTQSTCEHEMANIGAVQ